MNEELFYAAIESGLWTAERIRDTAMESAGALERALKEAADTVMPRTKGRGTVGRNMYWWNPDIKAARKLCSKIKRKLKKMKTRASLQDIDKQRRSLRIARIEFKNLIRTSKRRTWADLMNSVRPLEEAV